MGPPVRAEGGVLSTLIPKGPEFARLFRDFEHTAYRLERREAYNSPLVREALPGFLATGETDLTWLEDWCANVREQTAQGKRFQRVRVASVPLSPYNRFSVYTARANNEAGEDIRFLARNEAAGLPDHDYWLFDSRKLVRMHFDEEDDRFIGFEVIRDDAEIVQHNYWRDLALHRATSRDDFATQYLHQP